MNQYQDNKFCQNPQNEKEPILLSQNPPRVRLHTGIIGVAIVLGFVLALSAQMIVLTVIKATNPAIMENDWFRITISTLPLYFIEMPVAYLLFLTIPKSAPPKQKLSPFMWIGFLFLCFLFTYLSNFVGQFVETWIYNWLGIQIRDEVAEISYITPFGINLLFIGILAPIFEELFYRKAIIDRLRRYGDLPAILISGLIFGLVHGNFSQVFYTAAGGMLLGFVYVRTGNVFYTISLHMAYNLIGGVYVTEMVRRMGDGLTPAQGDVIGTVMLTAYSVFTVLSLVVGAIFLIANIRRFCRSLRKGEYALSFDKWMTALFFNPGVWVYIAWTVLMFVSSLLAS